MTEILIKYRDMLVKAYTGKYIHGLSTSEVKMLYAEANALKIHTGSVTCPSCILKTCSALGKYILEQEALEAARAKEQMTQETPKAPNNKTTKKAEKKAQNKTKKK